MLPACATSVHDALKTKASRFIAGGGLMSISTKRYRLGCLQFNDPVTQKLQRYATATMYIHDQVGHVEAAPASADAAMTIAESWFIASPDAIYPFSGEPLQHQRVLLRSDEDVQILSRRVEAAC